MEYDPSSHCQGRRNDSHFAEKLPRSIADNLRAERDAPAPTAPRWICENSSVDRPRTLTPTDKLLSAQVMEYYHKYSQSSSLGRYFSLPESGFAPDAATCYRRMYESIPEASRERYLLLAPDERSTTDSFTPRERRRWARPPLIGQPSSCENAIATTYVSSMSPDSRTPSPICKRPTTATIPEERNESSRENLPPNKDSETKICSPTSSVASHKPLEWDSGADVGYYNALPPIKDNEKKLCTIERMALARGCSAALRLDPEGTNESTASTSNATDSRSNLRRSSMKPDANSTPLMGIRHHESGESESEIEITPIVKNHSPGVIIECEEVENNGECFREDVEQSKSKEIPHELEKPEVQTNSPTGDAEKSERSTKDAETMKKSSSMNLLVFPLSKLSLKRSQSELNLRAKENKTTQPLPPLIFNSTSSIATVVNKPATCDKFIQTSQDACSRESIGIQVSVTETSEDSACEARRNILEHERFDIEEEKPPLPKRASSLTSKSLHSILKNSNDTYKIREKSSKARERSTNVERKIGEPEEAKKKPETIDRIDETRETMKNNPGNYRNVGDSGKSGSSTIQSSEGSSRSKDESSTSRSRRSAAEEEITLENATGRASNSFEYFPGHVYQNVPNVNTSHVSSIDTGRESRGSTMPNTSSSIDEKLWGDSDSLVRDLERSVNILKSLVDANKCDKQVKKRLIHHVIKRLVTAKYTDDRIERDLDENVPWNPADARNKIYRNEIIQALANKNNTTDSSADDWRPRQRNVPGIAASPKKTMKTKETRVAKEIIELVATSARSTPNTDEFPFDRHTDRTVMDGRKARMGLRCDDRRRETTNIDRDRSESSECFLPQSHNAKKPVYTLKNTNVFYTMNDVKTNDKSRLAGSPEIREDEEIAAATTTSSASSRAIIECRGNRVNDGIVLIKERTRTRDDEIDWRLPTTMSERRFEMGRCTNSESGDVKLINYAEMEKKNQLVWITNEISHLCHLKRLLQEPNKFVDRQRESELAGKRVDRWIRPSSRGRNERSRGSESEIAREDRQRASTNESVTKNLDNQWSSHGNLTGKCSINDYQRMNLKNRQDEFTHRSMSNARKLRNSCTQTGNEGDPSGHSKTGGEIVSSTMRKISSSTVVQTRFNQATATSGLREASVQTLPIWPEKSVNPESAESARLTTRETDVCSNVDEKKNGVEQSRKHVCYCRRYAAHSRHSACIVDSARRCARDHAKYCSYRARDDRPIIITATKSQNVDDSRNNVASNSRGNDFRKEAKNQLNANCKSKYAVREIPMKSRNRCADCELHDEILAGNRIVKEVETAVTRRGKDGEIDDISKACACAISCDCAVGRGCKIGDGGVDEKHVGENEKRSDFCETSSESGNAICHCRESFAKSRSCGRCDRCTDQHPSVGEGERERRKKISSRMEDGKTTENTRKSCRTCGTVWLVREGTNGDRMCSCVQDYLKPVAYELKFEDTNVVGGRNDGVTRVDKVGGKGLITTEKIHTKVNETPPSSSRSRGKCGCDEDEEKIIANNEDDENHRPGTLKDFLATNRPEFLDNVETRRQYMSEISQLRQLKKEKRRQFLAMAGTSAFAKPQKPTKGTTTNAQKKVSEYDMKLRLRMRYLRLNEVRSKRRQREKEEEARRNHLMAKLFGRKLQEKVLKGQVDLSQSVSVISNL